MYDRKKALFGALLKSLQIEFFGIFVMVFFWAVRNAMGLFSNILFGFSGLMCIVCILADYCSKQGELAIEKVRVRNDTVKASFGWLIGLVSMGPFAFTSLLLVLSKIGVLPNFIGAFKMLNAALFPTFDIFAHSAYIDDMHPAVFILVILYLAVFPITSFISFRVGFKHIEVTQKIMYKE